MKKKYLLIILIPIVIYIAVYIFLNVSYHLNKDIFVETYDIQGNKDGYVPQGLTYSEKYNVILQTSYNKKKDGMLYITDYENGELLKELELKNNDSHVGGIATNDDKVWITSNYKIYEYNLDDIMTTENDYIESISVTDTYNRGDFCYYKDNTLWIGDYHHFFYLRAKDDLPLLLGYDIDDDIDYKKPRIVVSIPNMVQGMAMLDDDSIVFTKSFSNLMRSRVSIYSYELNKETSDYYEIDGKKIPYYHIDNKVLSKRVFLSPMAEGIFYKDGYVYILFENSSDNYEFTYPKIRKIIKYKINN